MHLQTRNKTLGRASARSAEARPTFRLPRLALPESRTVSRTHHVRRLETILPAVSRPERFVSPQSDTTFLVGLTSCRLASVRLSDATGPARAASRLGLVLIAQEVVKLAFAGRPHGIVGHENRGDAPILVGFDWLTAHEANGKGSRILSAGRRQAEMAILPVETARHLILLCYCNSPSAAPGRRLGRAKRSGPRGPNAGRNVLNPNFQRGNTGRGLVVGPSPFCRVGCASRLAKPAE